MGINKKEDTLLLDEWWKGGTEGKAEIRQIPIDHPEESRWNRE